MRMDREQKKMDRRNERTIGQFMSKNEQRIRRDIDSTARAWDSETRPIFEKLDKKTRKQQQFLKKQADKAAREAERAGKAFAKAMQN